MPLIDLGLAFTWQKHRKPSLVDGEKRKNYAGSEKIPPTSVKEKEPLWY
jgi:hypothetical protein